MLTSIIVTCYNQSKYLSECLDSVLNQTLPDWECIIINDGSTDNSEKIAKEYVATDNRFHYIYQENQGVVAARNTGIRQSTGEFILPLDGDDKIASDYLELAVPILKNDDEVQLVYCLVETFGIQQGPLELLDVEEKNILTGGCCVNSSLFRRAAFDEIGGYKEEMSQGLEDWEFFMSLVERGGKFHKIEKKLFFYRKLNHSRDVSYNLRTRRALECNVVRLHPALYFKNYSELYWAYYSIVHSRKYKIMKILFKPYDWIKYGLRHRS